MCVCVCVGKTRVLYVKMMFSSKLVCTFIIMIIMFSCDCVEIVDGVGKCDASLGPSYVKRLIVCVTSIHLRCIQMSRSDAALTAEQV